MSFYRTWMAKKIFTRVYWKSSWFYIANITKSLPFTASCIFICRDSGSNSTLKRIPQGLLCRVLGQAFDKQGFGGSYTWGRETIQFSSFIFICLDDSKLNTFG